MRWAALVAVLAAALLVPLAAGEGSAAQDKQALLDLKAAAGNKAPLSNWTAETSPCDGRIENWPYIRCFEGRVISVNLDGLDLNVTLPDSLATMDKLAKLSMKRAGVVGSLPAAWSTGFPLLADLQMAGNNISGSLPDVWAGASAFPQLLILNLNDNKLSGSYPESWTQVNAWGKLRFLDLGFNSLGGILPAALGQASSTDELQALQLNDNFFQGTLPPEWGKAFPSLKLLDIETNNLTGPVPQEWLSEGSFPEIAALQLGNNWLGGSFNKSELATMDRLLPAGMGASPLGQRLTLLDLSANNFTGTLPADWAKPGAFPLLSILSLTDNWLEGGLPDAWADPNGSLVNLTVLQLANNTLSGPLNPKWATAGALPDLTELDLQGNQFSGSLPTEWGSWTTLSELYVDGNPLEGGLPPSWGDGTMELNKLTLCDTKIAGSIPPSWADDSNLRYVDISTDVPGGLCGAVPPRFVDGTATIRQCLGNGIDVPITELPAC